MPALSAREVADRVLTLLPSDGSPILNRVMRVMLSREAGKDVSEDVYGQARDLLSDQKKIGRLRGQGGQIFLTLPQREETRVEEIKAPSDKKEHWTEKELMSPARLYLETVFKKGLDLPKDCFSVIRDTSTFGPALGRFARPDFILVTAMSFDLMPWAQVDVHSFELKAEFGATDVSVYEALAQTRFTHFGHLIWHLPENSPAENRLADITEQCLHHGVGFIRARAPEDIQHYEIILDPVRKPTLPAIVEGFLTDRLNGKQKEDLRRITKGISK